MESATTNMYRWMSWYTSADAIMSAISFIVLITISAKRWRKIWARFPSGGVGMPSFNWLFVRALPFGYLSSDHCPRAIRFIICILREYFLRTWTHPFILEGLRFFIPGINSSSFASVMTIDYIVINDNLADSYIVRDMTFVRLHAATLPVDRHYSCIHV